mmetsp:Transcript_6698/g.16746  ORF Transcript_6698/g.16746 Transcript_6698/m.16746 type:complete len:229 (-) Transcript_6698:1193-1879(-)
MLTLASAAQEATTQAPSMGSAHWGPGSPHWASSTPQEAPSETPKPGDTAAALRTRNRCRRCRRLRQLVAAATAYTRPRQEARAPPSDIPCAAARRHQRRGEEATLGWRFRQRGLGGWPPLKEAELALGPQRRRIQQHEPSAPCSDKPGVAQELWHAAPEACTRRPASAMALQNGFFVPHLQHHRRIPLVHDGDHDACRRHRERQPENAAGARERTVDRHDARRCPWAS